MRLDPKTILVMSLIFLFSLSGMVLLYAQTTGKIIGNVSDTNTGEPVAGANVLIEGTTMGGATDLNGDFYIINVPPGSYTVTIQMIGYETVQVEKLQVSVNRSAAVNVSIKEAIMEGETISVVAEKVAVKRDQTSSIKNVSDEQIAVLPANDMDDIIEMQAGVIGGHFRGGRLDEVSYLIDGMQVNEVFRGEQSTVELEKEVVQDLEVITGTYNAEYGKAMSGIVNMVTKDGASEFHASASAYAGNYVTSHDDIFIGTDPADLSTIQDYKVQIEGPIWKNYISFIANARYQYNNGYLFGIRRFNVDDYSQLTVPVDSPIETPWDAYIKGDRYYSEHTGDGAYVPLLNYEQTTLFGKISFKPFERMRMAVLANRYESEQPYGFANQEGGDNAYLHSYKYEPDGMVRDHYRSHLAAFQVNHLLSQSMFYDLKLSYTDNWFGRYLYEDPLDLRYVSNNYNQSAGGFHSGGTDKTHQEEFTEQYMGKIDFTWQINKHHNVKSGLQFTQYFIKNKPIVVRDIKYGTPEVTAGYYDEVRERMVFNPWEPEILPLESIEMDQYKKEPYDFSVYLQDKMEYDELVLNFGLRYDYFNANSKYPTNRQNPANQGTYEDPSFMTEYKDAEPQEQWSPRLGLAYTLGQSAVLHFSYGHFFQMPPFYALYTNYRFLVPTNNFGTEHGNTQLKAQKTVKYEMGLWQQIGSDLELEVSVYYSDIYDLLSAVVYTTYNQIQYAVYDNKDYANAKGLEIELDWFFGYFWTGLNYTLQYTRGNADNPRSTYNRLAENLDPVPNLIPLGWDQRHSFNLNVGYSRENYALSVTGYYYSGYPYTLEPILESRLAKQNLLPNNVTKPSQFRVDLQGHYDFRLFGDTNLRVLLYIKNLLDELNEEYVYGSTGRAYTSILGNTAEETFRSNYNTVYDQIQNPGMFAAPREIRLGVGINF